MLKQAIVNIGLQSQSVVSKNKTVNTGERFNLRPEPQTQTFVQILV